MVSRKNIQYKQQQDAKLVPHYGLRKLSVGVASVLLGTVVYMQGSTAHADVNPVVSAGNDNVKVADGNVGVGYSAEAASGNNSADSASSVVAAGGAVNSMASGQPSVALVERATDQGNHAAAAVNKFENVVSAGQAKLGINQVVASDDIKAGSGLAAVPNRPASVAAGNSNKGRSFANLSVKPSFLAVSKVASTSTFNSAVNGGFDQNTWGKLDVKAWQGHVQGDYYQLIAYTGDANHVIVPNEADFEKAGISTSGKQVGVTSELMHRIFRDKTTAQDATVAFSKTDNKMVKAIGSNWYNTWGHRYSNDSKAKLSRFDGTNLDIFNVTNMGAMFNKNQISDLSSLSNWKVDNVINMNDMFNGNQINDLNPLANWKVDNVQYMSNMFSDNKISDLSPLANWNIGNVMSIYGIFDNNSSIQTKTTPAKRMINFVYPAGYTGKKQNSITQTIDVPTEKVKVELTANEFPTSYKISGWVTKTETPISKITDPAYFQDYTVPAIKGLLKPDQTVIKGQQADITKPINVTITYKLLESDTNDAFALDSKNGLHEHVNVNDNGGYDTDFWGTLDVSKFTTVKNGDYLEITGYTGDAAKVIIPNIADFELNNLDQGAKQVTISSWVMRQLAKNATRIGLSKTNNQKVVAEDADWSNAFGGITISPQFGVNGGMWVYNPNLTVMDLHNLDTTNITDISSMFNGGHDLKVVGDLSQWNTTNVTDMTSMFRQASKLTNIGDLDSWDTSKVTDMSWMFFLASALTNIGDLDNWDTSKVTNMSYMFSDASKLTNVGDLSKWNVSNVTNMAFMFNYASALTNIGDLSKWNTSKVTDMRWMFYQASALTNVGDLDNWDVSNVTDMSYMFSNASKLINVGDLSKWNVSNVTNMVSMFNYASALTNIGDLSKWNTSKVIDMSWMFYQASALTNIGDLDNWNTSKVTDMSYMFYLASKLTNIGNLSKWDVSNVTNMKAMFGAASSLPNIGDLSKWNTSKVTDMSMMFYSMTALKQLNISNWNLIKLANKDAFQYFVNGDPNLVVIANNVKLPTWYQNELSNSNDFWNNYLAVITNNEALLKASGSVDNVTVDNTSVKRPVFYDSKGSDDAVAVLKQADQAYIKQYQIKHPGYTLNLAADVDQTDSIALANASFVSAPREVQFMIAYYDLTGKQVDATTSTHKVGETVSVSPVVPANYVLVSGQSNTDRLMRWGLNEADFLVEPKVTTTTQSKVVTRTIKVQMPDGQTKNVVQTVTFVRNGYLNQVTKQTTYSPWSFNGQYQFSGYQPKPIDGYTVDVAPVVVVTPDSSDTMLNLTYHKLAADYSVDYQLANGTVVKNVSVTPENNGMVHLTAPQGYRLLTSVSDVQVGHSSQKLAVLVVPAVQTYTAHDTLPDTVTEPMTKTVTRTVKITMPNGHVRTVKQSVKFTRTATVDSTGHVTYGNWQAIGRAQFNKIFVPKRFGYHLAGQADKSMVTADMTDSVIEIKYVKN